MFITQMRKKGFCLLLAGILLFSAGCGGKTDVSNEIVPAKGRYVETEVTLPEEIRGGKINQIFSQNGKLRLLISAEKTGTGGFREWETDGETFTEVTPDWMPQLALPGETLYRVKILRNPENPETSWLYAAYSENADSDLKGHLWTAAGNSLTEITPASWQEKNDYGYYDYPNDIAWADGTLVGYLYDRFEFYQPTDGSFLRQAENTQYYFDTMAAWEDKYFLLAADTGQTLSSLEAFSVKDASSAFSIPATQENVGYNYMSIAENGDILLGNTDGFFSLRQGESTWEKLLAGMETSLNRLDIWCQGIASLTDGSFYALFTNENQESSLMRYAYDPEAVIEITETLTVYAVNQSFLLQQAAVLFHRQHPHVMIEIETALSQEEEWSGKADYQELSQNLNTRLMAGEGADILVMDRLNQQPYLEKGLLADINDIVAPLEESGELLSNITGSYLQEDGTRYVVPLSFAIALGVGREIEPAEMADLPTLVQTMAAEPESLLGPLTPMELLDLFLPYFGSDLVKGKELDTEALKTNLEYLKTIAANSGIIAQRSDDNRAYNVWDIPSKARLVIEENAGFNDALWPLAIARLVNGSYTSFGNAFYPKLEIGVNAQSKYVDTAKEFIAFALSPAVQNTDYYQGYPINKNSLTLQAQADRSAAEAETTIEVGDGGEQLFRTEQYDAAEAQKLLEICNTVSRKAGVDSTVREKIGAALPGFLDGSVGLEETMAVIAGELRMYLQE